LDYKEEPKGGEQSFIADRRQIACAVDHHNLLQVHFKNSDEHGRPAKRFF
jgi:hypothetical protein